MRRPNILYLHSHDTGRYVQPYGHQVPTPNIQALADQGVLFRQAFCAAPTCSASRACLLTGQYGHSSGMLGLAHRGWSLKDYRQHIVHTLRHAGYTSVLIGEQHIAKEPDVIGYDEVLKIPTTRVASVAPLATEVLGRTRDRPLFSGGRVIEGLVSHIDVYPTICDYLEIERPPFLQGVSLLPMLRGEVAHVREEVFAGSTWHAAYEPQRAVRTRRFKYIRRWG